MRALGHPACYIFAGKFWAINHLVSVPASASPEQPTGLEILLLDLTRVSGTHTLKA